MARPAPAPVPTGIRDTIQCPDCGGWIEQNPRRNRRGPMIRHLRDKHPETYQRVHGDKR